MWLDLHAEVEETFRDFADRDTEVDDAFESVVAWARARSCAYSRAYRQRLETRLHSNAMRSLRMSATGGFRQRRAYCARDDVSLRRKFRDARNAGIEFPFLLKGRMPMFIKVEKVRVDGGTQIRKEGVDPKVVAEYAEAMGRIGDDPTLPKFPAITVFKDETGEIWLADGFHRVEAAKAAGIADILADVRRGSQRDAIAFAVGSNAAHGRPRTSADLRNAIALVFSDREWRDFSDRHIARMCCCSHTVVRIVREKLKIPQPTVIRAVMPDGEIMIKRRPTQPPKSQVSPKDAARHLKAAIKAFSSLVDKELDLLQPADRMRAMELAGAEVVEVVAKLEGLLTEPPAMAVAG